MNQSQAVIEYAITNTLNPVEVLYLLSKASGIVKRISVWTLPDGAVGLFQADDGNNYEVVVRPQVYGQFKSLLGSELGTTVVTPEGQLPLGDDQIHRLLRFLEQGAVGSLNSLGAVPMGGLGQGRRRMTRKDKR